MADEKKQPYKKMRMGAVSATAWENKVKTKDGKDAVFFTVTIERNYKDKEDKWQTTSSFRVNDLADAMQLAEAMRMELKMKETNNESES